MEASPGDPSEIVVANGRETEGVSSPTGQPSGDSEVATTIGYSINATDGGGVHVHRTSQERDVDEISSTNRSSIGFTGTSSEYNKHASIQVNGVKLNLGRMANIVSKCGFNQQMREETIEVDHVEELIAYVQMERFGLPLDDNSQVMIKRKCQAYFRQFQLPFVEQMSIMDQAMPRILSESKLHNTTKQWLSDKKEYDLQVRNFTEKGQKTRRPGFWLKCKWFVLSCFSMHTMKKNTRKWQAAHPKQVLPKST